MVNNATVEMRAYLPLQIPHIPFILTPEANKPRYTFLCPSPNPVQIRETPLQWHTLYGTWLLM